MNRSLLLVICDFLILSLLALGNFEQTESAEADFEGDEIRAVQQADASEELIEALQLSLEEEQASRAELSSDLDLTEQTLREREEALAEREAHLRELAASLEERDADLRRLAEERSALEERVVETEAEKTILAEERARQEEAARRAREQALALERELNEKLAALERNEQQLVELQERQQEALEANRQLSTELQLSEAEKRLIRENLDQVRTEVQLVREEKERIQQQAGELAQGVSALAERSGELAQEFRSSQPKTANTLFSEFQENQVQATFSRNRSLYLRERETETETVFVTDGEKTYALFHIEETGLSLARPAEWEALSARLSASGKAGQVRRFSFLSLDPRLIVVEIHPSVVEQFEKEVYQLAKDPFRFSEAVLISSKGDYYGETTFTLDAENDRYVKMERRIMSRLFGELSPSRGDFVFSKTGELIGVMVTGEYCVLIDNFLPIPNRSLDMGENLTGVGDLLREMNERVNQLPWRFR